MAHLLLDENMPRLFGRWLVGHTFETVQQAGWAGVKNGALLRLAEARFDVFVTLDRSIPFQQAVANLNIAVLVLRVRSSRLDHLEPLVIDTIAALSRARAGTVTTVGDWP